MEEIVNVITGYKLECVLMAILICILTAVLKLPIKKLASKLENSQKLTRFIVFMPLVLGFGVNALFYLLLNKPLVIDGDYVTSWLSATSISLALYAVIEKMFPKKEKVLTAEEVTKNKNKIEQISKSEKIKEGDTIKNCASILQMILSDGKDKEIKK